MNGKFKVMTIAAAMCLALGGLSACGGGAAQSGSAAGAAGAEGGEAAAATEVAPPDVDAMLSGNVQDAVSAVEGLSYAEIGRYGWYCSEDLVNTNQDLYHYSEINDDLAAYLDENESAWAIALWNDLPGMDGSVTMTESDLLSGEAPEAVYYYTWIVADDFSSEKLAEVVKEVIPIEKGIFYFNSGNREYQGFALSKNSASRVTASEPVSVNGKTVFAIEVQSYNGESVKAAIRGSMSSATSSDEISEFYSV